MYTGVKRLFCEEGTVARALDTAWFLEGSEEDGGVVLLGVDGSWLGGCDALRLRGTCLRCIGGGLCSLPRGPGGVLLVTNARVGGRGRRRDHRAAASIPARCLGAHND
jgi:hypothetical protein